MLSPFRSFFLLVVCVSFLGLACQSDEEKVAGFMQSGEAYLETGSLDEAVIEFRNALQLDPNLAVAHYALANAYLELRRGNEAYWEFSETVRLDDGNVEAWLKLSGLSLVLENFEETVEQADQVIGLDPSKSSAYVLKARALERLDRSDEAEALYLKAIETGPSEGSYQFAAAGYYVRQRERAKAEPMLQQFAEIEPGFRSYSALARFLSEDRERAAEATAAFESAVETADVAERTEAVQNFANYLYQTERSEQAVAILEAGISNAEISPGNELNLIYSLARLHQAQGNVERADELIESATLASPDDPKPYLILSAYRGRKGDLDGALEAAEAALALAPEDLKARLRKAELLVDIGYRNEDDELLAKGQALVDEVLENQPSHADALFVLGKLKLAMKDPLGAIKALRAAIDSRPNWAQAHFVLGSALILTGDAVGARTEVARASELDPAMVEAYRLLSKLHASLGEHEYAVEQGRVYLAERPDDVRARIVVAQSLLRLGQREEALRELESLSDETGDAELLYAKGRLRFSLGQNERALALLVRAAEARPHHPEILATLLVVEQSMARLEESRVRILAAVTEKPDDAELVRLRGSLALATGDAALAEKSLQRATELDPKNMLAYRQLAAFYQASGRLEETLDTYERALEMQPGEARLHHFVGVLYELGGRVDDAIAKYERAIELDPDLGEAKNNLAYLLAETGRDLDRALSLAQGAKALMPRSGNAADTLGWVLYKNNRPSAAVGYLKEAVATIDPNSPNLGVVRHHLAQAYEASDQKQRAIETLEVALADLERRLAAAREAGGKPAEPGWSADLRKMLNRLKPAG